MSDTDATMGTCEKCGKVEAVAPAGFVCEAFTCSACEPSGIQRLWVTSIDPAGVPREQAGGAEPGALPRERHGRVPIAHYAKAVGPLPAHEHKAKPYVFQPCVLCSANPSRGKCGVCAAGRAMVAMQREPKAPKEATAIEELARVLRPGWDVVHLYPTAFPSQIGHVRGPWLVAQRSVVVGGQWCASRGRQDPRTGKVKPQKWLFETRQEAQEWAEAQEES